MIKNILLFFSLLATSTGSLLSSTLTGKTCIVFFSGGSNFMSPRIYRNFLSKLNQEYDLYRLKTQSRNKLIKLDYIEELYTLDDLNKTYKNIYFLAHSSGSTTAINNIDTNIDGIIMLDPVKTPFYIKNVEHNFKKILMLNADLSYKWSFKPPFIPFIPAFSITPYDIYHDLNIKLQNIEYFVIKNFGHTDIIDNPWRNIMHYSRLSRGNRNRQQKNIDNYHDCLVNIIKNYILS